jgi:hypothetical protein
LQVHRRHDEVCEAATHRLQTGRVFVRRRTAQVGPALAARTRTDPTTVLASGLAHLKDGTDARTAGPTRDQLIAAGISTAWTSSDDVHRAFATHVLRVLDRRARWIAAASCDVRRPSSRTAIAGAARRRAPALHGQPPERELGVGLGHEESNGRRGITDSVEAAKMQPLGDGRQWPRRSRSERGTERRRIFSRDDSCFERVGIEREKIAPVSPMQADPVRKRQALRVRA